MRGPHPFQCPATLALSAGRSAGSPATGGRQKLIRNAKHD